MPRGVPKSGVRKRPTRHVVLPEVGYQQGQLVVLATHDVSGELFRAGPAPSQQARGHAGHLAILVRDEGCGGEYLIQMNSFRGGARQCNYCRSIKLYETVSPETLARNGSQNIAKVNASLTYEDRVALGVRTQSLRSPAQRAQAARVMREAYDALSPEVRAAFRSAGGRASMTLEERRAAGRARQAMLSFEDRLAMARAAWDDAATREKMLAGIRGRSYLQNVYANARLIAFATEQRRQWVADSGGIERESPEVQDLSQER